METDFNKLAPSLRARILEAIERVNAEIGNASQDELPVVFTVEDAETEKKVRLKLVENEDGAKEYVFDYLDW